MMIISGDNNMNGMNGVNRLPHEGHEPMRPIPPRERFEPMRPIPPHERRSLMSVEFDESDWMLLNRIMGDEDTTFATTETIKTAPPEIQILAIQLADILGANMNCAIEKGSNVNMNLTRFPVPVLGEDAQELYNTLYGEAGSKFIEILNTAPHEIAVISRLIAYLKEKKGGS